MTPEGYFIKRLEEFHLGLLEEFLKEAPSEVFPWVPSRILPEVFSRVPPGIPLVFSSEIFKSSVRDTFRNVFMASFRFFWDSFKNLFRDSFRILNVPSKIPYGTPEKKWYVIRNSWDFIKAQHFCKEHLRYSRKKYQGSSWNPVRHFWWNSWRNPKGIL